VDEEEAAAAGIPAEGTPVRAAAVGGDERRRQVRDGREFAGGIEEGHQVPSLSGPSETGANNNILGNCHDSFRKFCEFFMVVF